MGGLLICFAEDTALRAGAYGALSGGVAWNIGHGQGATGQFVSNNVKRFGEVFRSISHGVAQGTISVLQGGKFKHSFFSAFASHQTGGWGKQIGLGSPGDRNPKLLIGRTVLAATIGGTVSKLTGGKFANGARTAAFVHLFNHEMADQWREEAMHEADAVENMSSDEREQWREWKIQQGKTEAGTLSVMLPVGAGAGATAKFFIWSNRLAYPLKYNRWGKLQPFNRATGHYMKNHNFYTNGEMLVHKSAPWLNGAVDFASSAIPSPPALNYIGLGGAAFGAVASPQEWFR